jgi:hypothetical protein
MTTEAPAALRLEPAPRASHDAFNGRPGRPHRWSVVRTAMLIALLAFVIYNANLRSISSFDTYPTRLIPISIIQRFTLDLDAYPFVREYPAAWSADMRGLPDPYYIVYAREHVMSRFPVMAGILAVPVYSVPVLVGLTDGGGAALGYSRTEIMATLLSKITASLAAALSVGIIYLTLLRLTSRSGALWITLIYAFATSTWSLSSQGLWQTSMSQPLLALSFYFLVKAKDKPINATYAGVPLALAVACRPTVVVFALVLLVHVARAYRPQLARFLVFPVLLGLLLVAYNYYYFSSIFGPYSGVGGVGEVFSPPTLDALLGLLVSPSRGLLVYSPVLVGACLGLANALWRRTDPLMTAIAVATLGTVLVYACWSAWDGGFSYSYRFLVDLVPGLVLLLGSVWRGVVRRRWTASVCAAAAIFSVFIQVVGAFDYPCGWTNSPVEATVDRGRFWDWQDPEFVRCARSGPVDPDGVRLLRDVLQARGVVG